jgi:hypothetical protein
MGKRGKTPNPLAPDALVNLLCSCEKRSRERFSERVLVHLGTFK